MNEQQGSITCQHLGNGQNVMCLSRVGRNGKGVGLVFGIVTTRRVISSRGVASYRSTLTVTTDPKGVHVDPTETHYHTYGTDLQKNLAVLTSFFRLNYASTVNRPPIELCQFGVQMLGACNFVIVAYPRAIAAKRVRQYSGVDFSEQE